MNANKKLAVNSVIQIVGKIIMTIVGLVSVRLLTTFLGVEGFGGYVTITTFLIMASILAELGLNVVLTTEIARSSQEDAERAISNIFTMRAVAVLAIVGVLSSSVVWLFPYEPEIQRLIVFGSLGTMGFSLAQVLVGIFQKQLRTDRLTLADLLARIVLVSGIVGLAWVDAISLSMVIAFYVLSGLVHFLFMYWSAQRYYRFGLAFDFPYWKKVAKEALPLFIIVAFNLVYYRIDTIMLSVIQDDIAVGLYGAAYKVLEILITFPGMFAGLLLPILAKYYWEDQTRFQAVFRQSFSLLAGLALPVTVGGILLSEGILELIAGEAFTPATQTLQILFVGIGCIFLGNFLGQTLIAAKLQSRSMYISIFGAVFNVGLNLVLIPRFSYLGAAIATAVTESLVLVSYLLVCGIFAKTWPRISASMVWMSVATLGMAGVLVLTTELHVVIQALLGAATFGGIMLLVGPTRLKQWYKIDISEA